MHISYHYHLADTIFLYSHWLPHIFFGITGFVSYMSTWWYYSRVLAFLRCTIHSLLFPVYSTFTLYFSHSRVVPDSISNTVCRGACGWITWYMRRAETTGYPYISPSWYYSISSSWYFVSLFYHDPPTFSLTSFCSPVVFIPGSCALAFLRGA